MEKTMPTEREKIVKGALSEFLTENSAGDSIGGIDEIVLSYIVGCLEELGSEDASEDAFDSDDFSEMMEAYLPGFAKISSEEVCEWMFQLADRLKDSEDQSDHAKAGNKPINLKMPEALVVSTSQNSSNPSDTKQRTRSTSSTSSTGSVRSRTRSTNSISSSDKDGSQNGDVNSGASCVQDENPDNEADEQINLLLEMFPAACVIEVTHCLCVVNGDMEKAAQLILHRQENGESISDKKTMQVHRPSSKKVVAVDDKKMKDTILAKYSYVDCDDDKKEHRPELPKKFQESKKLVRYLENQVVSTKGERFTEIKKKEDDEAKKTHVNLKPTKQCRFH